MNWYVCTRMHMCECVCVYAYAFSLNYLYVLLKASQHVLFYLPNLEILQFTGIFHLVFSLIAVLWFWNCNKWNYSE